MSFKSFALAATAASLFCYALPAFSQPVHYWTATQTWPQVGEAKSVVDSQGNVYVAQPGYNGTTSPSVVKFTSTGQVAWVGIGPTIATKNFGRCIDIKLTPDGGVIAGMEHSLPQGVSEASIQKFSSTGVLQWYKLNTSEDLISFDVDKAGTSSEHTGAFLSREIQTARPLGICRQLRPRRLTRFFPISKAASSFTAQISSEAPRRGTWATSLPQAY